MNDTIDQEIIDAKEQISEHAKTVKGDINKETIIKELKNEVNITKIGTVVIPIVLGILGMYLFGIDTIKQDIKDLKTTSVAILINLGTIEDRLSSVEDASKSNQEAIETLEVTVSSSANSLFSAIKTQTSIMSTLEYIIPLLPTPTATPSPIPELDEIPRNTLDAIFDSIEKVLNERESNSINVVRINLNTEISANSDLPVEDPNDLVLSQAMNILTYFPDLSLINLEVKNYSMNKKLSFVPSPNPENGYVSSNTYSILVEAIVDITGKMICSPDKNLDLDSQSISYTANLIIELQNYSSSESTTSKINIIGWNTIIDPFKDYCLTN